MVNVQGVDQTPVLEARAPDGHRKADRLQEVVRWMLGAIESGTALGALYVLLPADLAPPFDIFAVGCTGAVILGVVSHTPGGLGVFEATMIAILAAWGRADLMASLLVFRLSYNVLPFSLAVLTLGLRAGYRRLHAKAHVRRQSES